jgi:hypothetical protein
VYSQTSSASRSGAIRSPSRCGHSTRYTNQPEISPDGRRVTFLTNRDGVDAVYVADEGKEPRRIAGTGEHRYFRPHWSADGRFVLRDPHGGAARRSAAPGGRAHFRPMAARRRFSTRSANLVNDVRETRDGRWLLWAELSGYAMRMFRARRGQHVAR